MDTTTTNNTENTNNSEEEVWVMEILTTPGSKAFLKSFDPDKHNGRGDVEFTYVLSLARKFPSFEALWECWRTQSTKKPYRPDGKPNRPLTSFTIHPKRIK